MKRSRCIRVNVCVSLFLVLLPSAVRAFAPLAATHLGNNPIRAQQRTQQLQKTVPRRSRLPYKGSSSTFPFAAAALGSNVDAAVQAKNQTQSSQQQQPSSSRIGLGATSGFKNRSLKDKMWVRETLEDLTAAEFACSLNSGLSTASDEDDNDDETNGDGSNKRTRSPPKQPRKRAVDYENLLSKLDRDIRGMCCNDLEACSVSFEEASLMVADDGMSSLTYTSEQRKALLKRILITRLAVIEILGNTFAADQKGKTNNTTLPFRIELPDIRVDLLNTNSGAGIADPVDVPSTVATAGGDAVSITDLYVRDDGTVDWDGALQDRAALKQFGTAVWSRINGQDPESVDEDNMDEQGIASGGAAASHEAVTVKIQETEAIRMEKNRLDELMAEYKNMQKNHTALLNSAISAGQAVANINLATLDPILRTKIRRSAVFLEKMKEEVSFQTLMYELERIYTYLDGEMSSRGSVPLQDRLNVAEFGLLESQIANLNTQLQAGEMVDADVLEVVLGQLNDFKRRLGIDYYVAGLKLDREAIQRYMAELTAKAKTGVSFYVKGCQLFWDDVVFGLSLIGRALQGYTLKPREVRNLRRTFKDVITFIPVMVILITPLTPVGHVLVFGAIQRFFPGFFPSCFTEQRQNLLELYESTEYIEVTINETWQEKLSRILEAFAYQVANSARQMYNAITGSSENDSAT